MQKKGLKFLTTMLMLGICVSAHGIQSGICQNDNGNRLPIVGSRILTDNVTCAKQYIIRAPKAGRYYCRFWLMPALCQDGRYSTFNISVNGESVGSVTPTCGGWQTAEIQSMPRLNLSAGDNVLTITVDGSGIPSVDAMYVSDNSKEATFESDGYEAYMRSAKTMLNTNPQDQEEDELSLYASGTNSLLVDVNVRIKYSFFKIYYFKKGQTVTVTSTSNQYPHSADLFYMGEMLPVTNPSDIPQTASDKYKYSKASSDEIQGLNWKRNSSVTKARNHASDFTVKIPKTGLYMLKLRTNDNRVLTTADVSVAYMSASSVGAFPSLHTDTFKDVPIYYSDVKYIVPANISDYVIMTKGKMSDPRDPMLFVEGNDANRIVAFCDDASAEDIESYGLENKDACISQTFNIETSDIHISNYTSLNSETNYTVVCGLKQDLPDLKNVYMAARKGSLHEKSTVTSVTGIKTNEDALSVEIFDIVGKKLFVGDKNTVGSKLQTLSHGTYIVRLLFANGVYEMYKYNVK